MIEAVRVDPEAASRLAECERLGHLLADEIAANGAKRPTVSKRWISTLDRMIRRDGRSPEQIERAILWSSGHEFWSTNILSPEALRRHYDRMSMQARRESTAQAPRGMAGVREYLATLDD